MNGADNIIQGEDLLTVSENDYAFLNFSIRFHVLPDAKLIKTNGGDEKVGHGVPAMAGFLEWLVSAIGSGILGLVLGFALIPVVGKVIVPVWRRVFGQRKSPGAK